MFSPEKDCDTY